MINHGFNYESLTVDDRRTIHDQLAQTTMKHIDGNAGLFEAAEFDIARNPSQALEVVHLDPAPTSKEEVCNLARLAAPDFFDFLVEYLDKQPAFTNMVRGILADGVNIFPVTNHGFIADVALWSAAWAQRLDDDHWQQQNGLVISRGVTTIKAFDMAASEVVQKIGHVFMSFPRTTTIDALDIDEELITDSNRKMRSEVGSWLGAKLLQRLHFGSAGKSLHVAWSGKTDKVKYGDDHRPEHISMAGITKGTVDMLKAGYVLPVVLWNGQEPICEIGEITQVSNIHQATQVQNWQAESLAYRLGLPADEVSID